MIGKYCFYDNSWSRGSVQYDAPWARIVIPGEVVGWHAFELESDYEGYCDELAKERGATR